MFCWQLTNFDLPLAFGKEVAEPSFVIAWATIARISTRPHFQIRRSARQPPLPGPDVMLRTELWPRGARMANYSFTVLWISTQKRFRRSQAFRPMVARSCLIRDYAKHPSLKLAVR